MATILTKNSLDLLTEMYKTGSVKRDKFSDLLETVTDREKQDIRRFMMYGQHRVWITLGGAEIVETLGNVESEN